MEEIIEEIIEEINIRNKEKLFLDIFKLFDTSFT
jgi:hypothetical protein